MADLPGRSDFETDDRAGADDEGWGSPVPAQYGSLRSLRAPVVADRSDPPGPDRSEPSRSPRPSRLSASPADDGHDRWGVASLLRRLQGDRRPEQPAPSTDGQGPGRPAGSSAGGSPGSRLAVDRLSSGPVGRRVRWHEDSGGESPGPPAADAAARRDGSAPASDVAPATAAAGPGVAPGTAAAGAGVAPAVDAFVRRTDSQDTGFAERGRPMPGIADTAAIPFAAAAAGPAAAAAFPPDVAAAAFPPDVAAPPGSPSGSTVTPGTQTGEPTATAAGIDPAALGPGLADRDVLLGARRRRRRPGRVRTRATVRHVDIGTLIRVSVVFWLLVLVALVVASFLLWLFADAFGSLPSIEKSVRTLFSLKSFQLHPGTVAMYTAAGGVVIAIAGMIGTVVLGLIYNLIADIVGGVRVELESISGE